jgi:acetyl esterase/lipase
MWFSKQQDPCNCRMHLLFDYRIPLIGFLLMANSMVRAAQSEPDLKDVFRNELACWLIEPLLADMPAAPLYAQKESCISVVPDDAQDTDYFADESCQVPLAFEPTTLIEHCGVLIDSSQLGEGQGIDSPVWTLPPGTRFDVGARSLENIGQPYLQRQLYRTVETAGGTCSLEMRVYASHPSVSGQQSLLALHGGSWSARGFGFFGLEMTIPHFVDQGFVVYAPFYRLLGDSEGSAACHNASISDIVDDAQAALDWVEEHAVEFGSRTKPVVFGQSAGAHLATSLAVNNPESIAAAILFYPPTDFTDFALRAQGGFYTNEQGLGILGRVLGTSATLANINASPIPENSFPIQIVERDLAPPPMFMLHGVADDLVEARQSVRLCDALAGRELGQADEPISAVSLLREIRDCGNESELQLVLEGQHALDVCFIDAIVATDLCFSGSEASREQVSQAIDDAVNFARAGALAGSGVTSEPTDVPTRSGGGVVQFPFVVFLLLVGFIRLRVRTIYFSKGGTIA